MKLTKRKEAIQKNSDEYADARDKWINKNKYFYNDDYSYMRFLIDKSKCILDLGCGTGELLNSLRPSYGVGIELS